MVCDHNQGSTLFLRSVAKPSTSLVYPGLTLVDGSWLHKPVLDWLETLPQQNIRTDYAREIPIGHKQNVKEIILHWKNNFEFRLK